MIERGLGGSAADQRLAERGADDTGRDAVCGPGYARGGLEETGGAARLRPGLAVAPAERQGGPVGEHGVGSGGYRLGHRRSLDADAGELRARASALQPGR